MAGAGFLPSPEAGKTPDEAIRRSRTARVLIAAALLAAICIAYLPVFRAGFIWDDDFYIIRNRNLGSSEGLARIWTTPAATPQYYPLVHTSFWVESQLWGTDPLGYHLVNLLLHALNAFLVGLLLTRLGLPWPWLAAALFALHPVQVESVAWVTERKNLLSGAFALAAAMLYLPLAGLAPAAPAARRRGRYALVLLCFLCALLSKSVTAVLPVCLALIVWWKNGRFRWPDLRPLLPLLALGALLGLHTAWLERTHVGASGPDWDFSIAQRVLVAARAVWFYLATLVWPLHLSFQYPKWEPDPAAWEQWIFPLAALAAGALLWVRRDAGGRGPLAAAACFVVMLFPALGFLNVYPMRYSFVADHFQYLACIAPFAVLAAAAAAAAAQRDLRPDPQAPAAAPARRRVRAVVAVLAAAILAVCALMTYRQSRIYESLETLWTGTLKANPRAFLALNNLGNLHLNASRREPAAQYYRAALAIKPDFAEARYNLGFVLYLQGDLPGARTQYEALTTLDPGRAAQLKKFLDFTGAGHAPP